MNTYLLGIGIGIVEPEGIHNIIGKNVTPSLVGE